MDGAERTLCTSIRAPHSLSWWFIQHALSTLPRVLSELVNTTCAHGGSLPLLLGDDDLDDERDEEEVDVVLEDDVDEMDDDLLLLRFRFLFSFP